jgi:hypothetical protein
MQTFYGDGTVEKVAQDAGYSSKTLYARKDVTGFLITWMSIMPGHNIFSVRRFFEEHPAITYTHVRMGMPSDRHGWDFEQAIEAMLAIEAGDPEWDEYEADHKRVVELPMSTDNFGRYLTFKRGGKPSNPIFRQRGNPFFVLKQATRAMWDYYRNNGGKEVEVIIREAK